MHIETYQKYPKMDVNFAEPGQGAAGADSSSWSCVPGVSMKRSGWVDVKEMLVGDSRCSFDSGGLCANMCYLYLL